MADVPSTAGDQESSLNHETHDQELIVSLLDRDLSDADRAAGGALVAACRSCAALHDDLRAMARATMDIATPVRPREFTLTPAMAESIRERRAGEPVAPTARLTGDMHESRSGHAAHDRLLIANLIDRSIDEVERARAEELLAACRDCEQLFDDLVALGAATRSMAVPARPRDFALSAADAERLRVRGWRRFLGAIGSPRDALSRPLALGLTTLGIAGLLFATIPSAFMASGGAAALPAVGAAGDDASGGDANQEMTTQASEAPPAGYESVPEIAAAPSAAASAAAEALPAPTDDLGTDGRDDPDILFSGGESSPLAGEQQRDEAFRTQLDEGPMDRTTMIFVAGLLLMGGLGLFLLRWTARRLGDG